MSAAAPELMGKERDGETGLDYFGARCFSAAQGRFTTADPLLNSGRPWEPQSWNRYAYTLNNPLKFTDPDGLWEFGACEYSEGICKAYQERVRAAYSNFVKHAQSFKEGSKERTALDRVIGNLGTEGDKNGVTFALGSLPGARGAQFDQSTKSITFDLPKLDTLLIDPKAFRSGYRTTTEVSGEIAHEGAHLSDWREGLFDARIPANGRVNWPMLENSERRAYTNESYVFQGAGVRSINQLWNPSWAAADAETLRSKAVSQWVKESVDDMKAQAAKQGVR